MIAGIDYSTHAVDVVWLDEDTDRATWERVPLLGNDAFDRARDVRDSFRFKRPGWDVGWDDVIAIGIEEPRGYNSGALYRVQGAILACLPRSVLVQPWPPSVWRKAVGLPGGCTKEAVANWAFYRGVDPLWPLDATDAYAIATATRMAIQVGEHRPYACDPQRATEGGRRVSDSEAAIREWVTWVSGGVCKACGSGVLNGLEHLRADLAEDCPVARCVAAEAELAAAREREALRVRDLQAASERVTMAERREAKLREAAQWEAEHGGCGCRTCAALADGGGET